MTFNYDLFNNLVRREYDGLQQEADRPLPWTVEETLTVFHYFLESYRTYAGEDHPPLKPVQIADYVEWLPKVVTDYADSRSLIELGPDWYPPMIDLYFTKPFRRNCDHRIYHFMHGDVRLYLLYDLGWM